jgi:hypothetical protein
MQIFHIHFTKVALKHNNIFTLQNFHRTVAALDTEIQDQRAQIDEVHQERVQARLNEKKRDAIRHYRDTLAAAIADPKPHEVLTALQVCVRV